VVRAYVGGALAGLCAHVYTDNEPSIRDARSVGLDAV